MTQWRSCVRELPRCQRYRRRVLKVLKLSAQGYPSRGFHWSRRSPTMRVVKCAGKSGGEDCGVPWRSQRHHRTTVHHSRQQHHRHQGVPASTVQPAPWPDQCQAVRAGPQCVRLLRASICMRELTREHIIPFAHRARYLDERGHRLQALQPPQRATARLSRPNMPCCTPLRAQSVGGFHPAQPAHPGRPDGFLIAHVPRSSRLLV